MKQLGTFYLAVASLCALLAPLASHVLAIF